MVLLRNNTDKPFNVTYHQRIAQIIFERAASPMIEITNSLTPTLRGKNGFGSSDNPKKSTASTTETSATSLPVLPPKASAKHLVNRKKNWPHSQRKKTGHSEEFDSFAGSHKSNIPKQKPPTVTFDDLQFMSKIHPVTHPPSPSQSSVTLDHTKPLAHSHKVAASERASVTISRENLAKSVGFQQIDQLVKLMPQISNKSLHVQQIQQSPFLDPGEVASMDSRK